MRFRDALALAIRSMGRRAGRVALTVLAVVLAAALLIALLTITTTARERVLSQITKGGPLAGITVQGRALDAAAVRRIRALRDVVRVSPVARVDEVVIPPNPATYGGHPAAEALPPFLDGVIGIDLAHPERFPLSMIAGRLPAAGSTTEVAVTEGYLSRVGLPRSRAAEVLGTELELGASSGYAAGYVGGPVTPGGVPTFLGVSGGATGRWTRAVVVGVVAQDAGPGELLAPIELTRAAWTLGGMDASGGNAPPFVSLIVEARHLADVSALRARIGALGYSTIASETLLTDVVRYVHVVEIVLTSIGLIALVIAAIGISNAMLAAVRERRREIGVLKAIGARDRDVLRVFVIEAALVGLAGGALGTAAGWGVVHAVGAVVNRYLRSQGLAEAAVIFPFSIVAAVVAGCMLLAAAAGMVPALRASRLPAVEAMEAL